MIDCTDSASSKERYDIELLITAFDTIAAFNRMHLRNVDFYRNGHQLSVDPKVVDEFEYCGLSNAEFVRHHLLSEQA